MRKALIACLIGLAALNGVVVMGDALAQQRPQGGASQGKQKARPAPRPAARCPDLGVGTTAFLTEAPGGPLAPNEIAISYRVTNDGNIMYAARRIEDQSVALEYVTAAGATRIAVVPAITTVNDEGAVVLAYNHSERGLIRAVIPQEAAGRRLRLRLAYASEGTRIGIPDCNEANNFVNLVRPTAAAPAATPAPAANAETP
jgi:hypothetical protein